MNSKPNKREREHMARVKELSCGVCGAPPPSSAHHIRQGSHYLCIPLCYECHQGSQGIHGDRILWKIFKVDEMDVLNTTIGRLV